MSDLETIAFTQYMMPRGRKVPMLVKRPEAIIKMANTVRTLGGVFEAEILTTGEVSLTVHYDDEDIAIAVVPNGPDVPGAVDELVKAAVDILAPAASK